MQTTWATPFELGNGNQTTTWDACVAFYQRLAAAYPHALRLMQIGTADSGRPLYAGVITADGEFDRERLRAADRPIFFNNNGIHPGEPEGIDVCMAVVRDLCTDPGKRAQLGKTVFLFIAVYNVDGCADRQNTTRTNQVGPEQFGFRGNARNLDLNRDFVKCDSTLAVGFNQFFAAWRPDVMLDTHTSNGADYAYTMTLIATHPDKLGGALGEFFRNQMLPTLYADMAAKQWPMCPYVDMVGETPEAGIEDFVDSARFSTGYAALHYTIGMMPETHMLKSFADRYHATRALVDTVLAYTTAHGDTIRRLRQAAIEADQHKPLWPVQWTVDRSQPSTFRFRGYAALRKPSTLGNYTRLAYDRSQPWEKDVPYYDRANVTATVPATGAYLIGQAWRDVIARLRDNGVCMHHVEVAQQAAVSAYRITSTTTRPAGYEGRLFHDDVAVQAYADQVAVYPGDVIVPLAQPVARYIVETLEPIGHDSFFRWGFFDAVLEKKEHYSDYVFEDYASELLVSEPALRDAFAAWKRANPALLSNQTAVLDFLFHAAAACREPSYRRYPIFRLTDWAHLAPLAAAQLTPAAPRRH